MPNRALITLAHGSRRAGAAAGIERLTAAAARRAGVPLAAAAHLEFNDPDLASAAARLRDRGADEAVVVSLLFTPGYHQRVDYPAVLADAQSATGLPLKAAAGLGTGADLADVLAPRCPAGSHGVLYAVGSADPQANAAVADLASELGWSTLFATKASPDAPRGAAGLEHLARQQVQKHAHQRTQQKGRKHAQEQAQQPPRLHVVPMFVTDGLLLDRLTAAVPDIEAATGASVTCRPPLGAALAGIVAARYGAAYKHDKHRQHQTLPARELLKVGV
ncbi:MULTISPECIES: sirohydrochlorin chelatase [unclassified Corynebacterium]|uniref:sirohydrochlorin chelatase n=1 Tax=unclassified Corynebacterium TaxID=2624378 RepID=UPI0034CF2DE5